MNSIKSVLLGICRSKLARSRCRLKCVGRGGSRLGRTWSSRCGRLSRRLLPRWRVLRLWRGSGRRRRPGCWSSGRECRAACNRRRRSSHYPPNLPPPPARQMAPLGTQVAYLPPGREQHWAVNGVHLHHQSAPTWYKPELRFIEWGCFTTKSCRHRSSCTREQPFAQSRHSRSPRWQWRPPTPQSSARGAGQARAEPGRQPDQYCRSRTTPISTAGPRRARGTSSTSSR